MSFLYAGASLALAWPLRELIACFACEPVGGRLRKVTHHTSPHFNPWRTHTYTRGWTFERRKMAAVEENFKAFVSRKKLEYSLKFPFLKESQIVAKLRRIWTNQRANCSTASLSGKFIWFHEVWVGYCFFSLFFLLPVVSLYVYMFILMEQKNS